MFVVGQLSVGHSEPSLLKISLAKAFSPLATFLHFPIKRAIHQHEDSKLIRFSGRKRINSFSNISLL